MLLKCTVIFLVIVAVQSATLQGRNIPVEIRYERLEHDATSNLAEKIQLSPDEVKENQLRLQKLTAAEELTPNEDHSNLNKNLEAKPQLSTENLLQANKHLPIHHAIQEVDTNNLEKLGELRDESITESSTLNKTCFIQKAQEIVEKGLETLRKNFIPKENELAPSQELWEKLENDVKDFFQQEKNKFSSRQDQNQQNIFQNFANGFQQMTNNFIQQFQGQTQNNNGTSGDEGTPTQQGPIQGFIGYFTGGVQNIVSNIQNIGQSGTQTAGNSTVLGDNGTGSNPQNFIGNIVNGVQQLFQGPQQGINQIISGNNTQGDTGTGAQPGNQGFFVGAISQINQVVGNIIPTQSPPAAVQGDAGTPTNASQSGNPIQQVIQSFGNIGTAFNQFIQGGQQNKPQGSEDETSSQAPNQNFIQSIGQNIGNAFQNIQNQFRPPSSGSGQKPSEGEANGSTNPIVGQVSNIGNQIQQVAGQIGGNNPLQNIIPGSSSNDTAKNPVEATTEQEQANEEDKKPEESEKKEVLAATE